MIFFLDFFNKNIFFSERVKIYVEFYIRKLNLRYQKKIIKNYNLGDTWALIDYIEYYFIN